MALAEGGNGPCTLRPAALMEHLGMLDAAYTQAAQQDAPELLKCLVAALHLPRPDVPASAVHTERDGDAKRRAPSPLHTGPALLKRSRGAAEQRSANPALASDIVAQAGSPAVVLDNVEAIDAPVDGTSTALLRATFRGELQYTTLCLTCECASQRREDFVDITLPVPADGGASIRHLFAASVARSEHLAGTNKYLCGQCNRMSEARRSARIAVLPPLLCIHLNRTTSLGSKTQCQVAAPLRASFADWCTADCPRHDCWYQLRAAVFHTGGSSVGGHYTAYARTPVDAAAPWLHFDDDIVRPVADETLRHRMHPLVVSSSNAYMLFYEREARDAV